MEEIWKSLNGVVEHGENYEVSNFGNVRSIDRRVNSRSGTRLVKGKMLKFYTDKYGYLKIGLYQNQKSKMYSVHRLVALAFIPNPENKPQVNHDDGVKTNNYVTNLEWATSSENQTHAIVTGLRKGVGGEENYNAKLSDEKILEIAELYKTRKYTLEELAEKFDSSLAVLSSIFSGKAWKHLNLNIDTKEYRKTIISDKIIIKVKELHSLGYSKRKIERESGVSRTTVTKILENY